MKKEKRNRQIFSQPYEEKKEDSKGKIKSNFIPNERGDITTDTRHIQMIINDCYDQLYANKLNKLDKMYKFLDTYQD